MTDPSHWGQSLHVSNHPCLQDFDAFAEEILKVYRDPDRELNAAAKAYTELAQGPDKSVRAFGNRIRSNWREAGWDEKQHTRMLYHLTWTGLRIGIKLRIKPLAPNG